MEKRLFVIVTIIMLIVSIQCNIFVYRNLNGKTEKIKETKVKTKTTTIKRKQFEMYYKKDGKYVEYTGTTFPEGYGIDRNMSKCYDANDEEISDASLAINNNSITVTSKKTVYCRLYLDETKGGLDIIDSLPANSGLSTNKLGDMRRYQGSSAKNYICINDTGAKCNSESNEMYRIIGIVVDGTDKGQIKVIKQTKYENSYKWNSKTRIGTGDSNYCGNNGCPEWPNNDLAQMLNSTFLSSLPTKVQNVIVSREWYYGDLGWNYASITADQMYQIESGQINTSYYGKTSSSNALVTNTKWQKASTKTKIGLMYIHDYAYASSSNPTSCFYSGNNYSTCLSSWIHMTQNGGSATDYEWLMTRTGRFSNTDTVVEAYIIYTGGRVQDDWLSSERLVRPVFYLTGDINIKSGGTGEINNPYILDLN